METKSNIDHAKVSRAFTSTIQKFRGVEEIILYDLIEHLAQFEFNFYELCAFSTMYSKMSESSAIKQMLIRSAIIDGHEVIKNINQQKKRG